MNVVDSEGWLPYSNGGWLEPPVSELCQHGTELIGGVPLAPCYVRGEEDHPECAPIRCHAPAVRYR